MARVLAGKNSQNDSPILRAASGDIVVGGGLAFSVPVRREHVRHAVLDEITTVRTAFTWGAT